MYRMCVHTIGRGRHQNCHREVEGVEGPICKITKKKNTRSSGNAGPPYVPSWSLLEILSFLKESVKHRQ